MCATEISPDAALASHGISTLHHQMPNGEYRFRLLKNDGTAYIRTEASDRGAWQKSHFHEKVQETYIVQSGWIAFASKVNGKRKLEVFREGEVFTTEPGLIHNVFMPNGSVIHTVKHGSSSSPDRITNSETNQFDEVTETLQREEQIMELDERRTGVDLGALEERYNVVYRHFDNLIWRLPVWTSGLLSATMIGLNSATQETISKTTGVAAAYVTVFYVLLMFLVMLLFSFVLYRFRVHQRDARVESRRGTPLWKSASTLFNLIVTAEAFLLLGLAMLMMGFPWLLALSFCLFTTIIVTMAFEWALRW
jgi:mannose-6-phosphate isomerase-like protein (cupin superfamily)